ncbi:phage distal tail protein [Amycolatopsis eburnea]|uniref:Siphovirus-type tail component C-terminal domain-containing protein n=1 Tax=Amycolatopsis eburnea TaxID=2267691 RepID=A0A3R9E6U2_9PSEU|nr:hypothetical protein [Amycolatopsis eburnea]RSD22010.1 hypothetical protein EIY87_09345 [Amycolatopsis eburnea]
MAGELITQDGQLQWRGLLLGAGSAYKLTNLEGWLDLPDMRDGDVPFDSYHGSQPGQLLSDRRTVTLSFTISTDPAGFTAAQKALRAATAPNENPAEEPLIVQWDGVKAMVNARCVRRSIPVPRSNGTGYTQGAIQWRATNPRLLHLPQVVAGPVSPPVAGTGGLIYPLVYPLVYGAAQSGGELVLENEGNAPAQPVFRITGQCTGPTITNPDTGQQLEFDPAYVLPAGRTLSLTHETRSVLLDDGVSRSNQLITRQWFTLPVGISRVRFTSADGQGLLEALYYSTSI